MKGFDDHLDNYGNPGIDPDELAVQRELAGSFDNPADSYRLELVGLIDMFEYELCAECGEDADKHTFGPDPLGKPHAWCQNPPEDDAYVSPERSMRDGTPLQI